MPEFRNFLFLSTTGAGAGAGDTTARAVPAAAMRRTVMFDCGPRARARGARGGQGSEARTRACGFEEVFGFKRTIGTFFETELVFPIRIGDSFVKYGHGMPLPPQTLVFQKNVI